MLTKEKAEIAFGEAMEAVAVSAYKGYIEHDWNLYKDGYAYGEFNAYGDALGIDLMQLIRIHDQQMIMIRLGQ